MRVIYILLAVVLTIPLFAGEPHVAQSNNNLGFKLIKESLKNSTEQNNFMISPISAHYALSMVLNGTATSTRGELLTTLGYNDTVSVEDINGQNQTLSKLLIKLPLTDEEKKKLPEGENAPDVVSIKNSAWVTNGATDGVKYVAKPEFAKVLGQYYQVDGVTPLDFKDSKSADTINLWTKKTTDGMIPKIIDADTLSHFVWVLLNTTYIEAKWSVPFDSPVPGEFDLLSGKKVQAQMMDHRGYSRFVNNSSVQVAELDTVSDTVKAYVILPSDSKEFLKLQTSDDGIWSNSYWTEIFKGLTKTTGFLKMPTFSFAAGVTLKKGQAITQALGLDFLFQDLADFSNIDGIGSPRSHVGIIKQASKIVWNEKGVKAAAATLVGAPGRSMPMDPKVKMFVNHPFYFAIYDEATASFLFLGQVVDPTK